MLDHIEKIIYLKKIPIFQNLTGEELILLEKITDEEDYLDGGIIFHEGTYGDKLYVIITGSVDILRGSREKGFNVTRLNEFDYFGEMSLFDETNHSATAKAVGNVQCLVIPREGFTDILNEYPSIAVEMLKVFARRLRETTDKIVY